MIPFLPVDVQGPKLTGSEPQPADSTLHTTEQHGQDKIVAFFPKEMVNEPIAAVGLPAAQKLETQSFHSTMLPNVRVSVYDALTLRYLHGCIPRNGLMQTRNIFALMELSTSESLQVWR